MSQSTVTATGILPSGPVSGPAGAPLPLWRRISAIGTGFGIAAGLRNLQVAIVKARPSGAAVTAETTIADYAMRPAAEWGAELSRFLAAAGESRLAATVLIPRHEVIVRNIHLPGVADKDVASAVELQIDTLHPYGDVEVAWGWSRAGNDSVLVGVAPKSLIGKYEALFGEAGIQLAAITFTPALMHAAVRIWSAPATSILCLAQDEAGRIEVYGESAARPIYSAEFSVAPARAVAMTRAELRLAADYQPSTFAEVLPTPKGAKPKSMSAYLAALAGSAPRAVHFANFLPAERRASHDRLQYILPAVLFVLLVAALAVLFVILPAIQDRRYREDLNSAARRLEPAAAQVRVLERNTAAAKARIAVLDDFRRRPQLDLDSLNELTRLLAPPIWTSAIEIYPDSIVITGEADNAAPLLKLLDSSPLFQNSEFIGSVSRVQQSEQFHIRTIRRGRIGRTTP